MSEQARSAQPRTGSFDVVEWPERLKARVVEPGEEPAIHGYDVESDLAVHHGFTATLYLTLTGELPEPAVKRALEVVLTFLAPVAVNEAPSHAAVVTRLCDSPARNVLAVAGIGLAERAHFVVEQQRATRTWLEDPRGPAPGEACADDAAAARHRQRLRAALGPALDVPALSQPLSRDAALIAVLFACGLRRAEQLEAVWMIAGLGASFAEGMATPTKSFREYPMNLPTFRYEDDR